MARRPRMVIAGHPHHLIIRGNNRQDIFLDDGDRRRFRSLLGEVMADARVAIHGYVLMSNHVHLVVTPAEPAALSAAMQRLGRRYVRYFNDRHLRSGTLWEGRFRAALIQTDRYLLACLRYVENNPVRAMMVARPADFPWSSHRHHVGLVVDDLLSPHPLYWGLGNTPFDREQAWLRLFEEGGSREELGRMRAMAMGRAAADVGFLQDLGGQAGVELLARPVGRPRKRQALVPPSGLGPAFNGVLPVLDEDPAPR